jgi:hypothetical protein
MSCAPFPCWLVFHSSLHKSGSVHSVNMLYPCIVTAADLHQNWSCFKFFQNIMISFVVKQHVLCGFSQKFYLFCCDPGFVLLFSVQVSLPGVKESWLGCTGVAVLPRGCIDRPYGAPATLQGCKMRNAVLFTRDCLCMARSHIPREVTLLCRTQRI